MQVLSVDEMRDIVQVLVSIRHADAESDALLDRFDAGELTFKAFMVNLRALTVLH